MFKYKNFEELYYIALQNNVLHSILNKRYNVSEEYFRNELKEIIQYKIEFFKPTGLLGRIRGEVSEKRNLHRRR